MKYLFFILLLFSNKTIGQQRSFNFYGNVIDLPYLSAPDYSTLISQQAVSATLLNHINNNIQLFGLQDWAIVLFLRKYVDALYKDADNREKIKILSLLLTAEDINNAIGIRNRSDLLALLSVDRHSHTSGIYFFDEDGRKLVSVNPSKEPFKIRTIEYGCYKCRDILFSANAPKFKNTLYDTITRVFYNNTLQKLDSITFNYSRQYINYSYDFPVVLANVDYQKYPVSPLFISTFFQSLNLKIAICRSKLDSVNFLLKMTQTIIKNELNEQTYGRSGFSSFPENALFVGKGDCDDKCKLFAFLLSYYFNDMDVIFLLYPGHVRMGVYNPSFDTNNKSFLTYDGKKYLIAETTDDIAELGDEFYKGLFYPPEVGK